MLKIVVASLTATLALMSAAAAAEPVAKPPVISPSEVVPSAHALALADQYFDAIHYERTVDSMVGSMMPLFTDRIKSIPGLTPAQNKAFMDALGESMHAMVGRMTPALRQEAVPLVARIYTEEELTQMVAFYGSPLGQSIIAKAPQVTAALTGEMRGMMPGLITDMSTDLIRRFCMKTDCSTLPGGKDNLDALFGRNGA